MTAVSVKHIFKGSSALAMSQVVANLAAFVLAWSIARGLGSASYGMFAAAYALATSLAAMADSGMRLALIREIAREPLAWRRLARHGLLISLLLGLLLSAAFMVLVVIREGMGESQVLRIWLLCFALIWVALRISLGILAGRNLFVAVGLWGAIERVGGASLVAYLAFFSETTLVQLAQVLFVWESLVVLVLWIWLLSRGWESDATKALPWTRFIRMSIPFGISAIIMTMIGRLDLVVLGFQQPPQDVAYYAAAQTLALLALFASISLSSVLFPSLAKMAKDGSVERARTVIAPALGITTLLMLCMASILIAGSSVWLTWIYGDEFSEGAVWLVLFSLVSVFPAMGSMLGAVILAWGWQKRWAVLLLCSFAVAAPLYWLAGKGLGIWGVAACSVLVQAVLMAVGWYWLVQKGLVEDAWWFVRLLLLLGISGGTVLLLGIGHPLVLLFPLMLPVLAVVGGICHLSWLRRAANSLFSSQ